jgi:hypothetical protein
MKKKTSLVIDPTKVDEVIMSLMEILDCAVVNGIYRKRAKDAIKAATGLELSKDLI